MVQSSSQGVLQYSNKLRILDVAGRYIVWLATVTPCFAMCAPSRQRFHYTCFLSLKLAVGGAIAWASVTQTIGFYWKRAGTPSARMLLIVACAGLRVVRVLIAHLWIRTSEQLPQSNNNMRVIMISALNVMILTGGHVLQFQSPDFMSLILVHTTTMISEAATNLGYMTCKTEVERWTQIYRIFRSGHFRRQEQKTKLGEPSPPDEPAPQLQAAWGPREESVVQNVEDFPVQESRKELFGSMVVLSNKVEVCTLLLTTLLFLVCRISTSPTSVQPEPWHHTISIFLIALVFEFLGDALVMAFANKWSERGHRVASVSTNLDWSVTTETMTLSAVVASALLGKVISNLCPIAGSGGEFLSVSLCPAEL